MPLALRLTTCAAALALVGACGPKAPPPAKGPTPAEMVAAAAALDSEYVAAFNRDDADALMADGKPHVAEPVLVAQSKLNPNDPGLWYLLAEIQGLSGNIVGLHQSRAEYFILNGNLDQAEKQLTYALKLTRGDFLNSAKINQRLADIAQMRAQMDS